MIVELTVLTDEGKPFILDGCTARMIIEDKKSGDQIKIAAEIRANKLISHVPLED